MKSGKIAIVYLVFLMIVSGMHMNAQNKMLDSVYNDYIKTTNVDQKLDKAMHMVLLLGDNNEIEKANQLISNLEKLSVEPSKAEYKTGMVLLSKALLYKTMDSADKSISFSKKAIPLVGSNKSSLAEAKSLILLNYYLQGHFDSCIQMGARILPEIKKSGNINSEIEVLMCVGRSHDFMGDRKRAIQISLSAIELAKQHQKIIKLSELYISMSTIYKGEDINVAKKYALESLAVLQKTKDERTKSVVNVCYLILGNVYYDMKNKDSALYYYDLCREASLKVNDRRTYLAALGNIGNVTYEQGNYAKALEYNFLTLKEYKQIGVNSEVAVAYGSLADIYKDMKNYPKAISYYDSALVITKQIQSADDFIYNYKGLSETYEMMGNDKEAFKYYRLYKQWNDSINNNQNSKKITQMELDYKYKSEQKEKDLVQKNKDLIT
ncbi:MAG: tetratricopeptide repeat protein, partial [Bacteroidota bacterium]